MVVDDLGLEEEVCQRAGVGQSVIAEDAPRCHADRRQLAAQIRQGRPIQQYDVLSVMLMLAKVAFTSIRLFVGEEEERLTVVCKSCEPHRCNETVGTIRLFVFFLKVRHSEKSPWQKCAWRDSNPEPWVPEAAAHSTRSIGLSWSVHQKCDMYRAVLPAF